MTSFPNRAVALLFSIVITASYAVSTWAASSILPSDVAPFRYPVGPDGWSKRVHGFGSLNYIRDKHPGDPYAPHHGQDWNFINGDDKGKPVVAVADGTVIAIDYECQNRPPKNAPLGTTCESTSGWGVTVLVEHNAPSGQYFLTGRGEKIERVYSVYAHLLPVDNSKNSVYDSSLNIQVSPGRPIKKGDPVGQVGAPPTPPSDVPQYHLHWEMLLQADAQTYRNSGGYGWDLTNHTDASEFVDNNLAPHYYSENAISEGVGIFVHTYGDGSLLSPLYPEFLLDELVPLRGVNSTKEKGKYPGADPCEAGYKLNDWQRAHCADVNYDTGYNGEIFWKSADNPGTAAWIPNLPVDGKYRVSVFVPRNLTYAKGIASYALDAPLIVPVTFSIDQSNCHLVGTSCLLRSSISDIYEVMKNPDDEAYGTWVTVGTYRLQAGSSTTLRLWTSASHEGQSGENVAVDAVRFMFVACPNGQELVNGQCVIITNTSPELSASPIINVTGGTTTLSWNTHNNDESICTLTGGALTTNPLSPSAGDPNTGSVAVIVTGQTTYTLTCGALTDTVTVETIGSGGET